MDVACVREGGCGTSEVWRSLFVEWLLSFQGHMFCSRARDATLVREEIIKIRRGVAVG
jgi:hypothetical protein